MVHTGLGCRRVDADVSKHFFFYYFSFRFLFFPEGYWLRETAPVPCDSVTSANNQQHRLPVCNTSVWFLEAIKLLSSEKKHKILVLAVRAALLKQCFAAMLHADWAPHPLLMVLDAFQIKPLLHLIEHPLSPCFWLINFLPCTCNSFKSALRVAAAGATDATPRSVLFSFTGF